MQMPQTSVRECGFECGEVVEGDELDVGHDGSEGLAVGGLVRGGDGAHGAAVEAVFECEEFGADVAAFRAQELGVGAGELECGFPGFGAGVGEEDAVEAGDLGEAERELGGVRVVEEVAGVDEGLRLRGDGGGDGGVVVAERADADAGEEIEVLGVVLVVDEDAFAAREEEG